MGARLFRNNVGCLQDKNGAWVTYGLCPGSSDLIGWTPVKIVPEMVGKNIAVFTAVEVKTIKGTVSKEQENFICIVEQSGGMAFVVRSEGQLIKLLVEQLFRG